MDPIITTFNYSLLLLLLLPVFLCCDVSEREALLHFKGALHDPSGRLNEWMGSDCCKWPGVACDPHTGFVTELDLRNPFDLMVDISMYSNNEISGKISSSLLRLTHLTHLDLSNNDFYDEAIPPFLGSLHNLVYLNLSWSGFNGTVPHQLGNLSALTHLDLSDNFFYGEPIPAFLGSLHNLVYLSLSFSWFNGTVPHQLGNLSALTHLDLSGNDFSSKPIPLFLCSLHNLVYLDLSYLGFNGTVPHQLGNLSVLAHLGLASYDLWIDDSSWITRLSSLQVLELGEVSMQNSDNLFLNLNMIPSIREIHLPFCNITTIPTTIAQMNFSHLILLDLSHIYLKNMPLWLFNITTLEHLDLSSTLGNVTIPDMFGGVTALKFLNLQWNFLGKWRIPPSIGKLCKLQVLDLSFNNIIGDIEDFQGVLAGCMKNSLEELRLDHNRLYGTLPQWLWELQKLKVLHLDHNSLTGVISESIGSLSSLEDLDLSNNQLNGTIPTSIGRLSNLTSLHMASNNLSGTVSQSHFSQLGKLKSLYLSNNIYLHFTISSSWVSPFRLNSVGLKSCLLGHAFPSWIQMEDNAYVLDISNTGISDVIPERYLSNITEIGHLIMSNNYINGYLPSHWTRINFGYLDLHSNKIEGPLPSFTTMPRFLILSDNQFSGSINPTIGEKALSVFFLNLSINNLSGDIPASVCTLKYLDILDLSINNLSMHIPSFWNSSNLRALDLSHNKLVGGIPETIGENTPALKVLVLSKNKLSGSIPTSICKLNFLKILDLSVNNLSMYIPSCWNSSSPLKVLDLSQNRLKGGIPKEIGLLSSLQRLHLNGNDLSGAIPSSLKGCTSLKVLDLGNNHLDGMIPSMVVESLSSLMILSLRSNMFFGEIPWQLMQLPSLQVIDFAHNNLTGKIPNKISNSSSFKIFKSNFSDEDPKYTSQWSFGEISNTLNLSVSYDERIRIISKGNEMYLVTALQRKLVVSIDLSSNNLSGQIPVEFGELLQMQTLNVSNNHLDGRIPKSLAQLKSLETLDLSINNLSGEIIA